VLTYAQAQSLSQNGYTREMPKIESVKIVLGECARIYVLVAVFLLVAAVVEAVTSALTF